MGLIDYGLARSSVAQRRLWWLLGNWETRLYRRSIEAVKIERPIFVCGLARAGSTMLLELLARQRGVVTHRYRDFPFVTIPIWWNRFLDLTARDSEPRTRAHGDLIRITPHSPEGMEELLWSSCDTTENAFAQDTSFVSYYRDHVRKLLWLRGGQRYVSKNNYHVPRIEQLLQLFPDAQFVIPVRHPASHVASLVRQHEHFCTLARADRTVPFMLAAAGHYEFGPQRAPRGLTAPEAAAIQLCWQRHDDVGGYALMWSAIYQRVLGLLDRPEIAPHVHIVKYEEFCKQPVIEWQRLREKLELPSCDVDLSHIVACRPPESLSGMQEGSWASVAGRLGYDLTKN